MIAVAFFILGLVWGSFVNALVWRLAQQAKLASARQSHARKKHQTAASAPTSTQKQQRKKPNSHFPSLLQVRPLTEKENVYSVVRGRSMCPRCKHTLAARDLVPVLSWVSLRGRCRYCQTSISPQYPLVELLTALLFAGAYVMYRHESFALLHTVFACVYIVFFMALTVYDVRWYLLPDRLVFPLVGVAGVQTVVLAILQRDVSVMWPPLVAALIIFGLFWGLFQVSGGRWIGGGDVKLAIALGILAGTPVKALLLIFVASLLGTLGSIPQLARGKQGLTQHIPFGPYLLAACVLVVCAGDAAIRWYQHLFSLSV